MALEPSRQHRDPSESLSDVRLRGTEIPDLKEGDEAVKHESVMLEGG